MAGGPSNWGGEGDDESDWESAFEEDEDEYQWDPDEPLTYKDSSGNPIITFVDSEGAIRFPCVFCTCRNCSAPDIQLVQMGFMPATYENIRTAFSFAVLDEYLLDNQEGKVDALLIKSNSLSLSPFSIYTKTS